MEEVFREVWSWIGMNEEVVAIVTAASIGMLVLASVSLPIGIARLPEDWFLDESVRREPEHPVLRFVVRVLRNVVGWVFIVTGIAMLILPGQGLLTIFIGLLLADIPGKRKVALKIVRRPAIGRSVAWIREKAGQPPLRLPDEADEERAAS